VTKDECERITRERLELWGRLCAERGDTPLLLVTMGHDGNCGRMALQTVKPGPSHAEMARSLLWAAHQLDPTAFADLVVAVVGGLAGLGKHGES